MDYLKLRELYHWGILGMKWGRRRFQNEDGSLTPAGRERYRKESTTSDSTTDPDYKINKIKEWKINGEYAKLRRQYAPTEEEKLADDLKNLAEISDQFGNKIPKDEGRRIYGSYPKMTMEELNERISRISKERTYSDLIGDTKVIKSGKTRLRETLQTVGGIAGIAAVVAPIIIPLVKKKTEGG